MITIHEKPSPNFNARPPGVVPDMIVIHGTVGTDSGDLEWTTNPASEVAYHYLIQRTGKIWRTVPETKRAWQAGSSTWGGKPDCNNYSIGIGISNLGPTDKSNAVGKDKFTDAQYDACIELIKDIRSRYTIPLERIVSHALISPGRKFDPWLYFEWMRLAAGLKP